jgi:hypothetical protein
MIQQPVVLVDFCINSNAKIPIIRPAADLRSDEICRVKNRLTGRFFRISRGKRNKPLEGSAVEEICLDKTGGLGAGLWLFDQD